MGTGMGEDLAFARVRLACGRIAGGADAMLEAFRFGVPEGPHGEPWSAEYHRESVHIYSESLPSSYQSDIARLFRDSEKALSRRRISSDLAGDWAIVTAYAREAAGSIEEWLASGGSPPRPPEPDRVPELGSDVPRVIHFDSLARLTTRAGVRRLRHAAAAVQQHFEADAPPSLGAFEQTMLRRLASGAAIADVAAALGYSERSMYREMSRLWDKLGVSGRAAGLRKATDEGLID